MDMFSARNHVIQCFRRAWDTRLLTVLAGRFHDSSRDQISSAVGVALALIVGTDRIELPGQAV